MTIGELIIPDGVDIYSPKLTEQYQNDDAWHCVETQQQEEEWPLEGIDMGDSCEWTPTEYWIDANGGMTADAQQYMYEQDSEGDLI